MDLGRNLMRSAGSVVRRWISVVGRAPVERANRAARVTVDRLDAQLGIGAEWRPTKYGEYYATSTAVHAAVKVRAEAVGRPHLAVLRRDDGGANSAFEKVDASDPLQMLLDRPNPVWSRGELWRSTESNLLLWGVAFWGIERDESGRVTELWPLRPDRMRVLPDVDRYVKGFVYEHAGARVGYLPDEVIWFRHFNPLDEFSGLSSVAPTRMAIDMGADALRFNRNFYRNSALPGDLAITTEETPTEEEVAEFYDRWESRFRGAGNAHRPILLSKGMDAKRLGISQRDMEFVRGLQWSVGEVSRAFGVPKVFLSELDDATRANVETLERFLWRNTVVPELRLLADAVNSGLAPHFDEFPGQYRVEFDLTDIETLKDSTDSRVNRQVKLLNAGVLTINEVRTEHDLAAVFWGDRPPDHG